jgi:TetR/AcrR family transcriptional regulator
VLEAPTKPKRSARDTRERILLVAITEFANKGLDGGRVDEIALAAGINKNLLYHHFGNKEGLFLAVLERAYEDMRQRQNELALIGLPPEQAMEKLIGFTFDHFVDTPEVISLLNSENLHKASHIAKSSKIRAMYVPLVDTIGQILREGEEEGVFRTGVDPIELYISISALGYFYLSNRWTLATIFDTELEGDERLRRRRRHVIDVIMSFLSGKPHETPA